MNFSRAFESLQSYASKQQDVAQSLGASCSATSVDGSSVDGDGVDQVLSGYPSDIDERSSYTTEAQANCARNVKRKRTVKRELSPAPKAEKKPYVFLVVLKNYYWR